MKRLEVFIEGMIVKEYEIGKDGVVDIEQAASDNGNVYYVIYYSDKSKTILDDFAFMVKN